VEEIRERVKGAVLEAVPFETRGDKDKTTPLASLEGTDFFTFEIEQALLKGEIDAAVHSAKDLEEDMPEELIVAAITGSIDPFDSLVSAEGLTLDAMPAASRIGTSSRARQAAIEIYRPDLTVKDIRGNVEERLAKLDNGLYDAIIVANAALIRLGLEGRAAEILPRSIMDPHPMQGRLAVQVRRDRADLIELFGEIDGR